MPNHVKNVIAVMGDKETVKRLIAELQNKEDECVLDFSRIIPMPESLDITCGSSTDRGKKAYAKYVKEYIATPITNAVLFDYRSVVLSEEDYIEQNGIKKEDWDLGKTAFVNTLLYGHPTWYEWRIKHWGTKWNSFDGSIEDIYENDASCVKHIMFSTAWSAPHPVIEKLIRMYPTLKFDHRWADEDIGNNCGERIYENGLLISEIIPNDADSFAMDVWGYEKEEMNK